MRKQMTLLALLGALASPAVRGATGIWTEVDALRNDAAYTDATPFRRASVRILAARLAAGATTGQVPADSEARARDTGMVLGAHDAWVTLESRKDQADGYYAFRVGGSYAPLVLQTPHSWYDLNTGRVSAALFEDGFGRVLCMNTAHRYRGADAAPTDPNGDADVAHRPDSLFQAVTLGVVEGLHDPLVVQLHGFGAIHEGMAAVVSDGSTLQPSQDLERAAAALRPLFGSFGAVYTGDEFPDLAATENVQGRALSGTARFLHIETSYTVRRALMSDKDLRARLGAVLEALAARDTTKLGGATP